ncbi:hypothetical protein [Gordonia sp. (in: high G+C Gram-positive bacteria)]|uniref:hypothetical protein n=1 Tax=Gordonia sp. (in: high G+C Gram-positive bacteria) TaxID=84139 RepID=UPI003C721BF3
MKLPNISAGMSRRVRALLACGILLGTGAVGTAALWSTTAATTSGQFTTAGVEIMVGPSGGPHQASYNFTFPGNLLPGSTTAQIVQVKNTGGIPFTFTSAATQSGVGAFTTLTARRSTTSAVNIGTGPYGEPACGTGGVVMAMGTAVGPIAAGGVQDICLGIRLNDNTPGSYANSAAAGTLTVTFTATAAS